MKDRKPLERFIFAEHQCPYCKSLRLYATGGLRQAGNTRLRITRCKDCDKKFTMVLVRNT